MRRSKSKTPSGDAKNKRIPSGPRVDWVPPHPAIGAQVESIKNNIVNNIISFDHSY